MRILLVGDAASLPAELTEFIADLGEDWQPLTATDGQTAMTAVATQGVDAVHPGAKESNPTEGE